MSLDVLKGLLPETAKDIKLNLASVMTEDTLSPAQRAGVLLACAIATREPRLVAAADSEARVVLTPEVIDQVRAVTTVMAMNNVYYRFTHLVEEPAYAALPARLRMTALGRAVAPKLDMELWAIAVSAINGCGMCMASHEKTLRGHGATPEQIQAAIRIAATVAASALALGAVATDTAAAA